MNSVAKSSIETDLVASIGQQTASMMGQRIDVLLVEDSPTDAFFALEALKESTLFSVSHVQRLQDALEILAVQNISVVLLDLGLPDSQCLETLFKLHAHSPNVPVIVLTARDDEDLAVNSAHAGAREYLVKNESQQGNLRRTIRHVLERDRSERALKESEQQLRAIIDTNPQCIKVISLVGTIQKMNLAGLRMVEADHPDSVIGQSVYSLIAPEYRDEYRAFHEAVCKGNAGTLEFDIVSLKGSHRSLKTVSLPLPNPDGGLSHLSLATDITDRKKTETDLLLRDRAIQAVSQGIIITDANQLGNPITYVSPGFEQITGYTSQEVVGKNCGFLQGPESDPESVKRLSEAVRDRRSCNLEILNYRKDGTPFWNSISISPVYGRGRKVTHFVGVQSDVTNRRELETQLRQSQKMEAIGQLAGGVAHDFNNLLTVILGSCEFLQEDATLSDDNKELASEIQQAGHRAVSLTAQLLAFSRQQVLKPKLANLNEVVAETAKMLRRLIGEDIALQTNLLPELWFASIDVGQIEQVLMNLAVNARDAMPRGGKLTIETANSKLNVNDVHAIPDLKPGEFVKISVADTGSGMDARTKARMFEPYFTTKAPGKGTGLGLPTVFGIVKQSGGHITVESEPGRGTTFRIYIPRAEAAAHTSAVEKPQTALARGTETVLVVEDEEMVRHFASRILRSHGYTVLETSNGHEALQVVENHDGPIHLVLTDVVMPEVSGRELSERLRLIRPKLDVLFMSGYTDDAVVRHGALADESHFIQKPFTPITLARTVRDLLNCTAST